jgi:hypothetical protein
LIDDILRKSRDACRARIMYLISPTNNRGTQHGSVMEGWEDYIEFVERPQEKFGGLPVCPFAKKARLRGEYEFRVLELTRDALLALASLFDDTKLHLIICVDPRVDGLTATEARELARELNATLLDMNLMATSSHPDDDFNIEGLYTRRSPHPAIHLMRYDIGDGAYKSLLNSRYYDRWTERDFIVGFPGLEHLP